MQYIQFTSSLHEFYMIYSLNYMILHNFTLHGVCNCFTWSLHVFYMKFYITLHENSIYYMFCTAYLECTFLLHVFHIVYMYYQHILHEYYMYYMSITWIVHISFWLQKNDPSRFGSQPAWSIFTRTLALGHLRGWLLHFILYWE